MATITNPYARPLVHNERAGLPAAKAMWLRYYYMKYSADSVSLDDLIGDNAILLLTDFCTGMQEDPPLKPNNTPYMSALL